MLAMPPLVPGWVYFVGPWLLASIHLGGCRGGHCKGLRFRGLVLNPRKLERGFRMNSAGIPRLPEGHEENDAPTFWLLL